ncbi:SufE family protein [uncultured Lamprocystis sp.]|jgi:cysteine desulfuration protein SufE|uniref:SufE family protein n=1 Tax=uncultured Lamprocystis sp. TaxID=543132 RepID=UPI0025E4AC25|nr:SufE family protein [uncultured Lamprocystis sp.]
MISDEINAVIEDFELLGDWDQRYQYLVEIGERLPAMPAVDKTEENWVRECMSTVHLAVHPDANTPPRLHYSGDCDTAIIKGVVAILVTLFSGKTAAEIEETDVDALFEGLHLEEHLSPNRHVGVYAIVEQMRRQARPFA